MTTRREHAALNQATDAQIDCATVDQFLATSRGGKFWSGHVDIGFYVPGVYAGEFAVNVIVFRDIHDTARIYCGENKPSRVWASRIGAWLADGGATVVFA